MKIEKEVEKVELDFGAMITRLDKPSVQSQNLPCPYRGKCLNFAVKKFWEGFSCEKCPYKKVKPEKRLGVSQSGDYDNFTMLPISPDRIKAINKDLEY